jgi:hypothetical protein
MVTASLLSRRRRLWRGPRREVAGSNGGIVRGGASIARPIASPKPMFRFLFGGASVSGIGFRGDRR